MNALGIITVPAPSVTHVVSSFAAWWARGTGNHLPGLGGQITPLHCAARWKEHRGGLTSALAIHRVASPLSCQISLDRRTRSRADEFFTGRAFECSDAKTRRAGGDTFLHCASFALWTLWLVKRGHDAVPCIRRERDTLSHRLDAREGSVMGTTFHPRGATY